MKDFPSDSGIFSFEVHIKPVSLQANSAKKQLVTSAIRAITKPLNHILIDDISVKIGWFVNPEERYEGDDTADIDNIAKPIIDALCGPDGIIVNDCQVQHLEVYWADRDFKPEHLQIDIEYEPDAFLKKDELIFIQIENALCMPIQNHSDPLYLNAALDFFENQIALRNKYVNKGIDKIEARFFLPIQRFFHKSRLNGFNIRTASEIRKLINNQ